MTVSNEWISMDDTCSDIRREAPHCHKPKMKIVQKLKGKIKTSVNFVVQLIPEQEGLHPEECGLRHALQIDSVAKDSFQVHPLSIPPAPFTTSRYMLVIDSPSVQLLLYIYWTFESAVENYPLQNTRDYFRLTLSTLTTVNSKNS